jgi:hypothetical protein
LAIYPMSVGRQCNRAEAAPAFEGAAALGLKGAGWGRQLQQVDKSCPLAVLGYNRHSPQLFDPPVSGAENGINICLILSKSTTLASAVHNVSAPALPMSWKWCLGMAARPARLRQRRAPKTALDARGVNLPAQQISLVCVSTWAQRPLEAWGLHIKQGQGLL